MLLLSGYYKKNNQSDEIYKELRYSTSLNNTYEVIRKIGFADDAVPIRVEIKEKIIKTVSLSLLECFRDTNTDTLRFFYQQNAPFDNNLAEWDLWMFNRNAEASKIKNIWHF